MSRLSDRPLRLLEALALEGPIAEPELRRRGLLRGGALNVLARRGLARPTMPPAPEAWAATERGRRLLAARSAA